MSKPLYASRSHVMVESTRHQVDPPSMFVQRWADRGVNNQLSVFCLENYAATQCMSIQSCTCTVHINGLSVALLSESHAPSNTTQKPLRLLVFVLMFEKLPFIIACKVLRQLAMPSTWCSKPRHSIKRWWHNSAVQSHFLIIQITYSWLNDKDSSCAANPRLTTSTRGHPIIHSHCWPSAIIQP